MGMKIGVCTGIENSELLQKKGYDYIEMSLSKIASMSEDEFMDLKIKVNISELKPYAFNVLFPGDIKLTGFNVDKQAINDYLVRAFDRAKDLRGKIVVFGSGGVRRYPENFSYEEAFEQLVKFLEAAGPLAKERGITIVIEPLRKAETNIINNVAEGLKLAKAVNHPNVRLLVDFYHMSCENESPQIILEAGIEYIKHLHIANPEERVWPINPGEAAYAEFFSCLKEIKYDAGISIEGRTEDMLKDAPLSIKCLRKLTDNNVTINL